MSLVSRANFRLLQALGISRTERKTLVRGEKSKRLVATILQNSPALQAELAQIIGIGDDIIKNLHEVLRKDFTESDEFLRQLMMFFDTHGEIHLDVYEITDTLIRTVRTTEQDRSYEKNEFSSSKNSEYFINERILLQSEARVSSETVTKKGGAMCIKIHIVTGKGITKNFILSFGDISTPRNKVIQVQKLLEQTGLIHSIEQKIKNIYENHTDDLTGLYNKTYISSAIENNTPYSVIFLDLDKFKEYNDTFGHAAGDKRLKEIAKILQSSVRQNDKVCRNGGDEFVIFINPSDAQQAIDDIKQRIQQGIQSFNLIERVSMERCLEASITSGSSLWIENGKLKDIILQADEAMLHEKITKGGEGELYRYSHKISKLPIGQQVSFILNLIAVEPQLRDALKQKLHETDT
ncbi:MAG: GGDEF domain-containing protein [Candidatus Gracilibacteria bacterium]|nr:GGDEF domain-containing protein [Candidatus Gracilibacteria bacterium]